MSDVECPYCGEEKEFDVHGWEEGQLHEGQCKGCEKYFVFEVSVSFNYASYKADCLNGEPHNFTDYFCEHWPESSYLGCDDCEERVFYKNPKYAELREKLTKNEVTDE